jgi:hypothetical protein
MGRACRPYRLAFVVSAHAAAGQIITASAQVLAPRATTLEGVLKHFLSEKILFLSSTYMRTPLSCMRRLFADYGIFFLPN